MTYYDQKDFIEAKQDDYILYPESSSSGMLDPEVKPHFAVKITQKNKAGEVQRKRCRVCHAKKIRKMTNYQCGQCPAKPGLCVGQCFVEYHENIVTQ